MGRGGRGEIKATGVGHQKRVGETERRESRRGNGKWKNWPRIGKKLCENRRHVREMT
jgi:hypothetical protein